MHIREMTMKRPARATSIEQLLGIAASLIGVIMSLETLLNFDVSAMLGKND